MIKSTPLVSVIIPSFNMREYIVETIDCCLHQTYPNVEVVVVDDGSTDQTCDLINEKSEYKHKVRYFKTSNHGGPSFARNMGFKESKGEYIQFLDADDLIDTRKFEIQVAELEEEKCKGRYSVAYCNYRFFRVSGGEVIYRRMGPKHAEHWPSSLTGQMQMYTVLHRFFYHRTVLETYGVFDTSLNHAEDLDLWIRLLIFGVAFVYNDNPMAFYRERQGLSMSNPVSQVKGYLRTLDKVENYLQQKGLLDAYCVEVKEIRENIVKQLQDMENK